MVKGEWLKEGAVVIDVGINRLEDGTICGDVDFESACQSRFRNHTSSRWCWSDDHRDANGKYIAGIASIDSRVPLHSYWVTKKS